MSESPRPNPADPPPAADGGRSLTRRRLLVGGTVAAAAATLAGVPWLRRALLEPSPVFLARLADYTGSLARTIREGLLAVGFDPPGIRGRRVLLKPNLVEPMRTAPHMTTHPAVLAAAAEVFRGWGADVQVGEGPGHVRDTEMALVESGLGPVLREEKLPFRDLNYEPTEFRPNLGGQCRLPGFHFPAGVLEADLIVSLPKLKTHHWMGLTAAIKNLYGTIPGCMYGWPKNVLHHNGIPHTAVDIYASLPPRIAIVDGITCMEGDGPILGTPKHLGLLAVGTLLPSLDATLARIMQFDPPRIPYLALLGRGRLGEIRDSRIDQRGEAWQAFATPFAIVDAPHLTAMRPGGQAAAAPNTAPPG